MIRFTIVILEHEKGIEVVTEGEASPLPTPKEVAIAEIFKRHLRGAATEVSDETRHPTLTKEGA